jgi:hypothetical protein
VPEGQPIAPELLDYVDDYIDESEINDVIEGEFDADSNLIVFCRELFSQVFANVIGEPLTGFSAINAQRANVLRRTQTGRAWLAPLRRLVSRFQHFCKVYTDLLSEGYSTSEARSDFHFEFIPSVLNDLEAWAAETGHDDLHERVVAAQTAYDDYLGEWEAES